MQHFCGPYPSFTWQWDLVGLHVYDTHALNGHFSKSSYVLYKNNEAICIPSPKYCLSTHVFKLMKHKFLSKLFLFWN